MGRGRGRPAKEIDQELFERMCESQCTRDEMCHMLDVSPKTLLAWCKRTYKKEFSEVYRKYWDRWNVSLRRNMTRAADEGNPTMMIYMDKRRLMPVDTDNPFADIAAAKISDELLADIDEKCQEIRKDLLEQLRVSGNDSVVNREMVEDYVQIWIIKKRAVNDINARGPVITYNNGGGQIGTKENPSVAYFLKLNSQMIKILNQLGLSGENAAGGDSFDGL